MGKKEESANKKREKEELDKVVLLFFWKKQLGNVLSNFFRGPIEIEDIDPATGSSILRSFSSGEHAFHGMKMHLVAKEVQDEERKIQLSQYGRKFEVAGDFDTLEGNQVKSKGGKSKNGMPLKVDELNIWGEKSVEIQRLICSYKFLHEQRVRDCLKTHRYKVLIHPSRVGLHNVHKCVWEGRGSIVDGGLVIKGGNMLGKIWMKIRDELL